MKKILTGLSIIVLTNTMQPTAVGLTKPDCIASKGKTTEELQKVEEAYNVWSEERDKHTPDELGKAADVFCRYIDSIIALKFEECFQRIRTIDIPYFEKGADEIGREILGNIYRITFKNPLSKILVWVSDIKQDQYWSFYGYKEILPCATFIDIMNFRNPNKMSESFHAETISFSIKAPHQYSSEEYDRYVECCNKILDVSSAGCVYLTGDQYSSTFLKKLQLHSACLNELSLQGNLRQELFSREKITEQSIFIPEEWLDALTMSNLKHLSFHYARFSSRRSVFDFMERNGVPNVCAEFKYTNLLEKGCDYSRLRKAPIGDITIHEKQYTNDVKLAICNLPRGVKDVRLEISDASNEQLIEALCYIIAYNSDAHCISVRLYKYCDIDDQTLKKIAYFTALNPELHSVDIGELLLSLIDVYEPLSVLRPIYKQRTVDDRLRTAITAFDQTLTEDELERQVSWIKEIYGLWKNIKDATYTPDLYAKFQVWGERIDAFLNFVANFVGSSAERKSFHERLSAFLRECAVFYHQMIARNTEEFNFHDDECLMMLPQKRRAIGVNSPNEMKQTVNAYQDGLLSLATKNEDLLVLFSDYLELSLEELKKLNEFYEGFQQHCKEENLDEEVPTSAEQIKAALIKRDEVLEKLKEHLEALRDLGTECQKNLQKRKIESERSMQEKVESDFASLQEERINLLMKLRRLSNNGAADSDELVCRLENAAGRSKGDMLSAEIKTVKEGLKRVLQLADVNPEPVITRLSSTDDLEEAKGVAINTPKIECRKIEAAEKARAMYQMVANICSDWIDNACVAANAKYEKISEMVLKQKAELEEMLGKSDD